jgi:glutamine synthetase
MSELAMAYIGGILKHAPALATFTCPTTGSYRNSRQATGRRSTCVPGRNSAAVRIPMALSVAE